MAKTRKALALGILALAVIFVQQNLRWSSGLYGVGPEANLSSQGLIKEPYNIDGIYLVKTKKIGQQLQCTYRLSTSKYFKLPLWPLSTSRISYNCKLEQLSQIENLFKSDLAKIKLLQTKDVDFFINAIIMLCSVNIILIWLLIGKSKSSKKFKSYLYIREKIYH